MTETKESVMDDLPVFITGNQDKANYLASMLGISLEHQKVSLDELQSTHLEEIVEHKVKQAYSILQKPVLVEDVSLGFTALGGLPGPFIKFFVETPDGLENVCRMLDGFSDRSAVAECVFGYYDGQRIETFRGSLKGTIAKHPRGQNGYGWDTIFEPLGYGGKTRAELGPEDDKHTYEMIKPFQALRDFLGKEAS
ncbi:MAG TPA: non-canonical purine NTP pyrophosphatase [Candidatus Saccharimonadales bacterium]|nr:non-canonical purine NTP pyrophosphatase [Candidatus Saccharimonadales bacterium]